MEKQNNTSKTKTKDKNIDELLKRNLKMSEEMHKMLKDVKRYIFLRRIWTAIKILIIVIPITLGIFYLPPIIQEWVNKYQGLLNFGSGFNAEQDLSEDKLQKMRDNLTPEQRQRVIEVLE